MQRIGYDFNDFRKRLSGSFALRAKAEVVHVHLTTIQEVLPIARVEVPLQTALGELREVLHVAVYYSNNSVLGGGTVGNLLRKSRYVINILEVLNESGKVAIRILIRDLNKQIVDSFRKRYFRFVEFLNEEADIEALHPVVVGIQYRCFCAIVCVDILIAASGCIKRSHEFRHSLFAREGLHVAGNLDCFDFKVSQRVVCLKRGHFLVELIPSGEHGFADLRFYGSLLLCGELSQRYLEFSVSFKLVAEISRDCRGLGMPALDDRRIAAEVADAVNEVDNLQFGLCNIGVVNGRFGYTPVGVLLVTDIFKEVIHYVEVALDVRLACDFRADVFHNAVDSARGLPLIEAYKLALQIAVVGNRVVLLYKRELFSRQIGDLSLVTIGDRFCKSSRVRDDIIVVVVELLALNCGEQALHIRRKGQAQLFLQEVCRNCNADTRVSIVVPVTHFNTVRICRIAVVVLTPLSAACNTACPVSELFHCVFGISLGVRRSRRFIGHHDNARRSGVLVVCHDSRKSFALLAPCCPVRRAYFAESREFFTRGKLIELCERRTISKHFGVVVTGNVRRAFGCSPALHDVGRIERA